MDVKVRLLAPALAALAICAPPAGAAPGDLDGSFSGDGRVSTLTSPDTFVARGVAVQPDGRIVVAGYSCDAATCGPTGDSSFRLVRYTPDGGLDTDFGAGGMVTTAVGPVGRSQAFDVVVRSDGRIIAGGVASADMGDPGSFALVGYRANGTLDPSFGAGGRVITRVGSGFDAISDLVPVRGDRVVAVGQAMDNAGDHFALARYDGRGMPDPGFGNAGTLIVPTSAPYAYAAAGTALPDGRVVAVGASGASSAVESLRFIGAPVGSGGGASAPWIRPIGASYSYGNAAVALADGRVLSAGVATERTGNPAMALVRTSAEGVLDRSWDADGLALVRARDATVAADLLLDPEGRAVAAGHASAGANHVFTLARFDGAGALDPSFGGGLVLTAFPGATVARATALARQGDGKLVVAGIACASGGGPQCTGGTARLALARYDVAPGSGAAPGPRGGAPPAGAAKPRAAPFVSLPSSLRAHRGRVRVKVRCRQAKRCRGTLTLRRLRTGRRSLLLGSRTASVPARRARTIVMKVRRKRLGTRRRVRVRMQFAGRDATGARRKVARRVTLRRG
jgi:uncharacterized delta-60 repeat protein